MMNCAICGKKTEESALHEHGFYFGPVGGKKKKRPAQPGAGKRRKAGIKVELQTGRICNRCLGRRAAVDATISVGGLALAVAAIVLPLAFGGVMPRWLTVTWTVTVIALPALAFLVGARLPGLFRPDIRGDRMLISRRARGLKAQGYDRFYTRREVERQQARAEKRKPT